MAFPQPDTKDHNPSPSIMASLNADPASFLGWDEKQVAEWVDTIGYGQYKDLLIGETSAPEYIPGNF